MSAAWRWVAAILAVLVALLAARPLYRLSLNLPPEQLWSWLQDRPPAMMRSLAGDLA